MDVAVLETGQREYKLVYVACAQQEFYSWDDDIADTRRIEGIDR